MLLFNQFRYSIPIFSFVVTLVLPARKGRLLDDVLEIADLLLNDSDDLVQKGYGWMLKETGPSNGVSGHADIFEGLQQHRERDNVHVGDGVFEAGNYKRGYGKDNRDSLVDNASSGKRHPHRHAH